MHSESLGGEAAVVDGDAAIAGTILIASALLSVVLIVYGTAISDVLARTDLALFDRRRGLGRALFVLLFRLAPALSLLQYGRALVQLVA